MASPVADSYSCESGASIRGGRSGKTAHVFIESGQSNCQGVAPRAGAPAGSDPGPIAGVKTWRRNQDGTMYSGTGAWYPLDYEYNQYEGRNQFGSVLQFGLDISASLHDDYNDIYIIKADGNGKPIVGWLSGSERTAMFDGHITPALASLVADETISTIKIHGFFWDQGESDCDTQAEADAYESRLNQLIADVRAATVPNLPVMIRQLGSHLWYTYKSTVIAAQSAVVAADANAYLIEGPFTYLGDNLHLDAAAQNSIGTARHTLITSVTNGIVYSG